MEPLGSHYAILLHDAHLRKTIDEASHSRPVGTPSDTLCWLRVRLARMLIGLAAQVEPEVPVWSMARRSGAVPGD